MRESEKLVRECLIVAVIETGDLWKGIISRGGRLKPIPSGVYQINIIICDDHKKELYGSHPSSIGSQLACKLSMECKCPALAVDPPSTDEFSDLPRI